MRASSGAPPTRSKPLGAGVDPELVWAACRSDGFSEGMRARVTGTTGSHQRVDKAAVADIEVPNIGELPQVSKDAVRGLVEFAYQARAEAQALSGVREELLPLLLSGRVSPGEVAA